MKPDYLASVYASDIAREFQGENFNLKPEIEAGDQDRLGPNRPRRSKLVFLLSSIYPEYPARVIGMNRIRWGSLNRASENFRVLNQSIATANA